MRNRFLYKIYIITILSLFLYSKNNHQIYNLETNIIEEKTDLQKWLELFAKEKDNYQYLKKIKPLLIKDKKLDKLISLYEQHLETIKKINDRFEVESELLEIKIWNESDSWELYLYQIIKKYCLNNNNLNQFEKKNIAESILYKLIQNKKVDETYNLVKFLRQEFKKESNENEVFFSKKLISVFSKEKRYKEAIEESIIYLNSDFNNKRNQRIGQKILKEQIFILTDKLLENALIENFYLPITNKQFSSNSFLNYDFPKIDKQNDIEYIINVYERLIEYDINSEEAQLKLADIKHKIINDLDKAYNIYNDLEKKSSKIDVNVKTTLGKAEILIAKGYLDSASTLIQNQKEIFKKFKLVGKNKKLMNDINYLNTQILFYKGEYSKMNQNLDSLIQNTEFQNMNNNDLLEVKTISLFFNQDIDDFKKYASIQYKIKMNKSFESMLDLIQLINTENILVSELAQFQYAIIELQKGNIDNVQSIISSMSKETIFYEILLILNAEIEDHINKNYKKAMELYEQFIEKYPNSIYKEHILKRLNEINKLMNDNLDS